MHRVHHQTQIAIYSFGLGAHRGAPTRCSGLFRWTQLQPVTEGIGARVRRDIKCPIRGSNSVTVCVTEQGTARPTRTIGVRDMAIFAANSFIFSVPT